MADAPVNPKPTPTPAPVKTVSVNEPKPQTASVNEPKPQTANVNEPKPQTASVNQEASYDTLSVDEKDNYLSILEEKDKQGLLSVDERNALNKGKEETKKEATVGSKDGDENQAPDPEKKGPFVEKDIIQYMYEDWLLGGANWLYTEAAAKLEKGYYSAQRAISERRQEKQRKAGETYETQSSHNQITNAAIKSGETNEDAIEKHRKEQLDNLELLKAGKIDEAKISDATKVLLKNMDKKEREQFFKISKQGINNFYDNMSVAERFATNYARAGMTLDVATNKDYYKDKDLAKEFETQKRKAMIAFSRKLDQEAARGGDPHKLAEKLFNLSQEAVEQADKTVENKQFNENDGKKPHSDLAEKITKISDIIKPFKERQADKPRGLYEASVEDQNFDRQAEVNMENNTRVMAGVLYKQDENNKRTDRIKILREKMGITPENADAYNQVANNQDRQEKKKETSERRTQMLGGSTGLYR